MLCVLTSNTTPVRYYEVHIPYGLPTPICDKTYIFLYTQAVRSRVDLESHTRRLSVGVRTAAPLFVQCKSTDNADPSVAQRKHRVSGEIPSLAKVNVNKVTIF